MKNALDTLEYLFLVTVVTFAATLALYLAGWAIWGVVQGILNISAAITGWYL